MSWWPRHPLDPERLHEERMRATWEAQDEYARLLHVLAEQIRVIRRAVGLPPDLEEIR